MLEQLYKQRKCNDWDIKTPEDLLRLAKKSERELYFFLTYAYAFNLDLSDILQQENLTIRLIMAVYTRAADDYGYIEISEYYKQYLVTDESLEQASGVLNEIRIAERREVLNDAR